MQGLAAWQAGLARVEEKEEAELPFPGKRICYRRLREAGTVVTLLKARGTEVKGTAIVKVWTVPRVAVLLLPHLLEPLTVVQKLPFLAF